MDIDNNEPIKQPYNGINDRKESMIDWDKVAMIDRIRCLEDMVRTYRINAELEDQQCKNKIREVLESCPIIRPEYSMDEMDDKLKSDLIVGMHAIDGWKQKQLTKLK